MSKVLQDLSSNDYVVIDNVFSKEDYNILKKYFNDCEWSFLNETNTHSEYDLTEQEKLQDFGLVNVITVYGSTKDGLIEKAFSDNVKKFFELDSIDRIKAGLFPPAESEIIHQPHTDLTEPHWTGLYYFSTEKNAGHTYIYNQRFDPFRYKNANEQLRATKDNFEIETKIEAKENRVVFFKGDVFHSSSRPRTIFKRIAINVNFRGRPLSV